MNTKSGATVVPFPSQREEAVSPLTARDAIAVLMKARAENRRNEDFATFERELHQRVMGLERELLASELSAMDIDAPEVFIEGVAHRRALRAKQTYLTSAGEVVVERTLYRPRSGPSAPVVSALDREVGIVDGYLTPVAANLALYVVTELTPGGAEELFKRIGNMAPSKSTLDRLPKHVSEAWEENRETFEGALRAAMVVPQGATTVAVSLDGVLAPSTDGNAVQKREETADAGQLTRGPAGYREFGCGTLSFCDANGELLSAIRFARSPEHKKETLKAMLTAELAVVEELRPDLRLVKLADGALDNWTFLSGLKLRSTAGVELVDFFHAAGKLGEAIGAAYGDGTQTARRRFADLRHVLLEADDGADRVIRSLGYLRKKHPSSKKIVVVTSYFRKNRHRMNYAAARRAGLPIGSGVVEAACKTLVAQRLKRSGMRWTDEGAQAILTPRGWLQSGRFDDAWALIASIWQTNVSIVRTVIPLSRAG